MNVGIKGARVLPIAATAVAVAGLGCGAWAAQPAPPAQSSPPPAMVGDTNEALVPVTIPDDVRAKIAAPDVAYIESGHATRFVNAVEFFGRIRAGTAQQAAAYIAALRTVEDSIDYKPGRDVATVPLDKTAPDYNAWKMRRPSTLDPKRTPGPISLSGYMGGGSGIPTFANAPVAINPEDLTAGKIEVAIVGAPLNMGSGFRDALHGPLAVRTNTGAQGGTGNDMYTQINPARDLRLADYGDIAVDNLSTDRTVDHVRDMVREIAKTGAIPIIVGGDHSLSYPDIAALADIYGKGKIGVVHFDSHFDAWHDLNPHLIDHGAPVYRLISEGHVLGKHYIQVGLRSRAHTEREFKFMRDNQMRYHTMAEVEQRGWEAVMERAISEAKQGTDKLFISFDVDVLDPAFAPATGTPVPGGLTMREAEPIVRRLCAENDVVGMDLVEVAPYLDSSYKTTHNSNFILNACLTGIAMHKKGITQPHYLNPVVVEHGQTNYYKEDKK